MVRVRAPTTLALRLACACICGTTARAHSCASLTICSDGVANRLMVGGKKIFLDLEQRGSEVECHEVKTAHSVWDCSIVLVKYAPNCPCYDTILTRRLTFIHGLGCLSHVCSDMHAFGFRYLERAVAEKRLDLASKRIIELGAGTG